jgi:OOP family OmpA-OmpF porin
MSLTLKVLFILLLAGYLKPLLAYQETSAKYQNADSFYLGFKLGGIRYQHGCQPFALDCDKRSETMAAFTGYHFNEHLALELSYADLGEVNARYTEYGSVNDYDATMKGFDLGLLAQYPLTSKLSVFAKGGAFKWHGTNAGPFTSVKDDDLSMTLAAGFRYQFNQQWRARFSYQLIEDLGNATLGSSNGHIAWLGLSYQFGHQTAPQRVVSAAKEAPVIAIKPVPVYVEPKFVTLPAMTAQVIFDFDKSDFIETDSLKRLVKHLVMYPQTKVKLIGHTDSTGSKAYNLVLSAKRTDKVALYLANNGVLSQQISKQFKGYDAPVIDNLTKQHRQQNRRVGLSVAALKVEIK